MPFDKKLVRLYISRSLRDSLKRSADDSRRAFGHELVLRIEYGLTDFENNTKKIERSEANVREPYAEEIQIYLKEDIHTRLKTMASSSNMSLKDFTEIILTESEKNFKSIATSKNVILKIG